MSATATYRTTLEHVLYTVLDEKLLNKLAKQYKKQVDKAFNEEEQIKERKAKVKIGKEFLLTEAEEKDMPQELDLEMYVDRNKKMLQKHGLEYFLSLHGWTMEKLCAYFTQSTQSIRPITSVSF